jgi:hypothetical protein
MLSYDKICDLEFVLAILQSFELFMYARNSNAIFRPDKGKGKGNSKATPLQAWTGIEGSRSLRLPDFNTIGT